MANTKKYISLDKLGLYDEKIKGVVSTGDEATLASAKAHAESLGVNYDAAGTAVTEAGKVQTKLNEEAERAQAKEAELAGSIEAAQGEVDALETVVAGKANASDLTALSNKVGNVEDGKTVVGMIEEVIASAYNDSEVRGLISGLDTKKADKDQVALDIAAAVKVEEEARIAAVAGVQGAVDTLSGTHATDKAALEGAIALKADQTSLDAVSGVANAAVKQADYDVKVAALEAEDARIAGLVATEAETARAAEKANANAIAAIKEDVDAFFKDADMTESAKDTLKELQQYIASDETAASEMAASIQQNKKAIEDHAATDHDFAAADTALKTELEGKINGKVAQGDFNVVEGRVDVVEGKVEVLEGEMEAVEGRATSLESRMTTVEGAVATKAEAQALTDAVSALQGKDTELAGKISALEGKLGESGDVATDIATAKQEAIDAAAADAETKANAAKDAAIAKANELNTAMDTRVAAVEAASATHALASDLTALAGRVTTAEGEIDTLQTEMDAVELLADAADKAAKANAQALALKASQEDLTKVANRVTAIETWHENFVEASEEEINGLFV